ncbi:MAG: alpha/beta hydrolase [Devosia sp.]
MLSSEAAAAIARMLEARAETVVRPGASSLADERANWEAAELAEPLPAGARSFRVDAGGVPAEWVSMPGSRPGRAFFLLHGGGYNSGSCVTHRRLAAEIARHTQLQVLTPDYRLAPEHPFPAAVDDALMAWRWLLEQGYSAKGIVVGGDSAGGGLALSMLLSLREANLALPRAAVLMSPWTDLTVALPSHETMRARDAMLTQEALIVAADWYARGRLNDPVVSPVLADLRGLPPLLIHVGGDEVLLDDSRVLAQRARDAGVTVNYKSWLGLWHVFHSAAPNVPESVQALVEIAAFIRSQFGDQVR